LAGPLRRGLSRTWWEGEVVDEGGGGWGGVREEGREGAGILVKIIKI
jgi:hypothetical protein